eukprot:m.63828 g.63828  ORF g.63828 m.63828 type:complete len:123 (+) comp11462_c0_seq7:152-520(+)
MQSQHNTYEDFEEFLDSPLAVKQMHDGRRISSVRLGHVIGSGAFGKVFTGTHSFTGDGVAVKQLPKPYSKETNICIRNEIEIMSRLSHPQIVLLYQVYSFIWVVPIVNMLFGWLFEDFCFWF